MAASTRYLTSPGYAVAARVRAEMRLQRKIDAIEAAHLTPQETLEALRPYLPPWAGQRLLRHGTDPEKSRAEEMLDSARALATAAYNHEVQAELAARTKPRITTKMWVTRHDPKVRPSHQDADADTVALFQPFVVGGYAVQYPGDSRTAPPEIWMNCRCVIVGKKP